MSKDESRSPREIDIDELVRLRLDPQVLGPMVSRSQFDRAAEHFREVIDRVAEFPEGDKARFFSALEDEDQRRDLAIALHGLMYGKPAMKARFEHCLATLHRHDLASWPLITVWFALLHPGRFRLIDAAEADRAGWPLDWDGFCQSQRG